MHGARPDELSAQEVSNPAVALERRAELDDVDDAARLELERDDRLREYGAGAAWAATANTDRTLCPAIACDRVCGPFTSTPCECRPCACQDCQAQRARALARSREALAAAAGTSDPDLRLFDA